MGISSQIVHTHRVLNKIRQRNHLRRHDLERDFGFSRPSAEPLIVIPCFPARPGRPDSLPPDSGKSYKTGHVFFLGTWPEKAFAMFCIELVSRAGRCTSHEVTFRWPGKGHRRDKGGTMCVGNNGNRNASCVPASHGRPTPLMMETEVDRRGSSA